MTEVLMKNHSGTAQAFALITEKLPLKDCRIGLLYSTFQEKGAQVIIMEFI